MVSVKSKTKDSRSLTTTAPVAFLFKKLKKKNNNDNSCGTESMDLLETANESLTKHLARIVQPLVDNEDYNAMIRNDDCNKKMIVIHKIKTISSTSIIMKRTLIQRI